MKKFLLYAMVILGDILLYKLSEQSEGAEWLFALLIAGLFAWSVQGWRRYRTNGFGLFFLTAFGLFMMNSVLYLLSPPFTTVLFSLLFGFILIPINVNYHDEVLTSWWLVVLNILVHLEVPNEVIFWFTLLSSGIGAVIGFRKKSTLFKRIFTVCFLLNAGALLVVSLITETYINIFLSILLFVSFFMATYLYQYNSKKME